MADVLQTVANQYAAFGIPDDELYEALRRCETRNRDRGRITAEAQPRTRKSVAFLL